MKKHKPDFSHIPSPHDRAFRSVLGDVRVAREFFEHYLPASVRTVVDLSVLRLQNATFVDPELSTGTSDLLYQTAFRLPQQETGYIYLTVEQQTEPDYWMPLRMLRYLCRIFDQHRRQYPTRDAVWTLQEIDIPLFFRRIVAGRRDGRLYFTKDSASCLLSDPFRNASY